MKTHLFLGAIALIITPRLMAQPSLTGTVTASNGKPLHGASVKLALSGYAAMTDGNGHFSLAAPAAPDTLLVSFVGYMQKRVPVGAGHPGPLRIVLSENANALDEVVINTGYYETSAERSTGAFSHVDNSLLNRSVSTNILERLEGVVNGVQFVQPQAQDATGIRVRGLSTIEADTRPLVVLDNFPYEGDINSINPNDVESITVLRDAAAASIWGARAGNGVIVINTKRGQYNAPARITANSNITVGEKPDLFYNRSYLPSPMVMEIQKEQFERGVFQELNQTYIPSYVELLIKKRDGLISDADFESRESYMQQTDLRKHITDYLHQPALNQQYALNIRGGGNNYLYAFSAGYDANRSNIIGNGGSRLNLSLQNTFRVSPNLELTGAVWYTNQRNANNGISHSDMGIFTTAVTRTELYDALVDPDGNPAPTYAQYRLAYRERAESLGLLDWMYRPLDEQRLADNTAGSKELRLNAGTKFSFLDAFVLNVTYQYLLGDSWSRQYHAPESYYVRNMVNRFTQADGSKLVPAGGILELGSPTNHYSHAGRAQLSFNRSFGENHEIAALGGGEIRGRTVNLLPAVTIMDYDPELMLGDVQWYVDRSRTFPTRPTGSSRIPAPMIGSTNRTNARDLSYFGNASYTYRSRYTASGSLRWDGSNLLGVKTNQRGTALWSIGGSWEVSKERFFRSALPYLRLRTTYGSAGNIDKTQSHYPTITVGNNSFNGLRYSALRHPGNPSLRWEQVNTFNAGLDWRLPGNRIGGALEYYNKHAKYLLGNDLVDPTTGAADEFKTNYANLRTQGWDVQVNTRNLTGELEWQTTFLINYTYNRITNIAFRQPNSDNYYVTRSVYEKGKSVDKIYAFPWYGLNPANGYPLLYLNGQQTDDYAYYYSNVTKDELVDAGVTVPPFFGSVRNTFKWKGIEIGALIAFKAGYVFRRKSIGPGQEYLSRGIYHMDYFKRWKQPGDELHTDVPAWAETAAPNQRGAIYENSMALITPGNHIRLQDINAAYSIHNVRVYAYARNLGVLWRANKHGLDPDYENAAYPAPRSFAVGLQIAF